MMRHNYIADTREPLSTVRTILVKAFSKIDGSPKSLKMGGAKDFKRFSMLNISPERAEELHLLFIEGKLIR